MEPSTENDSSCLQKICGLAIQELHVLLPIMKGMNCIANIDKLVQASSNNTKASENNKLLLIVRQIIIVYGRQILMTLNAMALMLISGFALPCYWNEQASLFLDVMLAQSYQPQRAYAKDDAKLSQQKPIPISLDHHFGVQQDIYQQ